LFCLLVLLLLAVAGQEMAEALTPDVLKLLVRAASMTAAGTAMQQPQQQQQQQQQLEQRQRWRQ
jgi:hypothetical protein